MIEKNSIKQLQNNVEDLGNAMVTVFHTLALFVIGATIVWAAVDTFLKIVQVGHADLHDILLLFIYLELGAMVGIYFKTHRLPVRFLIYICITALTRHLIIDMNDLSDQLVLILTICILLLTLSILVLQYSCQKFGSAEEDI